MSFRLVPNSVTLDDLTAA